MGNVRFPQYRTPKKQRQECLRDWQIGAWTTARIFLDKYDVSKEEVADLLLEAHELLSAFGTGEFNPNEIFATLQKETGIEFKALE